MSEPQPELDDRARDLLERLRATAEAMPPSQAFVCVEPERKPVVALLLKRTYRIENGRCVPVDAADENPICTEDVPWAEVPAPLVAPLIAARDGFPLKPATDVIIQATAHALEPRTTRAMVSVRFGATTREIVVVGDRRGEVDGLGRPRFSEPEPFERIPVRFDHAYGGFDVATLRRLHEHVAVHELRPEWGALAETPAHYPRNPTGVGYVVSVEDFAGKLVPNLEHPFDPLTPERMIVGSTRRWIQAPLPAAWDFQAETWFPRAAYLGLVPKYEDGGRRPAEVTRGWAAEDLLSIRSVLRTMPDGIVRAEYGQCAAPGMSVRGLAADETFELRGLHPSKPVDSFALPGEVPKVEIELDPGTMTELAPHLHTVVVRAPLREVEVLWCARAESRRRFDDAELVSLRRNVRFERIPGWR